MYVRRRFPKSILVVTQFRSTPNTTFFLCFRIASTEKLEIGSIPCCHGMVTGGLTELDRGYGAQPCLIPSYSPLGSRIIEVKKCRNDNLLFA